LKPERKFWLELKKKTPNITWTRIENLALPGVPDLLGYNKNHLFFTVELKVTVKSLASSLSYLYEGYKIEELVARGLALDACCSKLDACCLLLESLGA
jgi:hypothetical protein